MNHNVETEQQGAEAEQEREDVATDERPGERGFDPLEQLEREKADVERQAKELQDRLLRNAADFENFKKRLRRDVDEAGTLGREALIKELLPALDNLERALQHAPPDDVLAKGVQMVEKQLLAALEKFGVVRINALGQPFDPSLHEAIQEVEKGDLPVHTVVQQFASGYRVGQRLLRAAVVAVSKAPEAGETPQ